MAQGVNYANIADRIATRTAKQFGLDPGYFRAIFHAQINQESGFNPSAHSPAGAQGIAQIVPKWHPGVNTADPVASLNYAARMDAQNWKKYGNPRDMLAVYNSGRPWSVSQRFGETNNYVKSILAHSGDPGAAWGGGAGDTGKPLPPGSPAPDGLAGYSALRAGLIQNALAYATGGQETPIASLLASLGTSPNLAPQGRRTAPVASQTPFLANPGGGLVGVPLGFATRGGISLRKGVAGEAENLAKRFGLKINSGYRDPKHNAEVGGAPHSDHLSGNAVDFTGSPANMKALYNYALKRGYAYVEPWAQAGGNHVHISFARGS